MFWDKFFRGLPVAGCIEVRVIVIIFAASVNASVEEILPQAIDGFIDLFMHGEHWPWTVFETKAKKRSKVERGLCIGVMGKIVCGHVGRSLKVEPCG